MSACCASFDCVTKRAPRDWMVSFAAVAAAAVGYSFSLRRFPFFYPPPRMVPFTHNLNISSLPHKNGTSTNESWF